MDSHIHIFKLNFIQKTSRLWCPNYMINSKVNTHYKVFILRVLCLLIMCQTIPQGDQHISQNDMITKQLCCLCHWPKCENNSKFNIFCTLCPNFFKSPFFKSYSWKVFQQYKQCGLISLKHLVFILLNLQWQTCLIWHCKSKHYETTLVQP